MACRVSGSRGRWVSPRNGIPAATAPELTINTSWPSARSFAVSPHSFAMATSSMRPWGSVSDDVPILATILTVASPPAPHRRHLTVATSPLVLGVVELEAADAHGLAAAHPGAGEGLVDTEAVEAEAGVVERFEVREVGESDGALGR